MKTTIELPEATFRQVKALAASRGVSMKSLYTEALEALEEHLARRLIESQSDELRTAPWMAGFGALSDLKVENRRILNLIEEEFEVVSPDDLA